jgi:hypothetical protein
MGSVPSFLRNMGSVPSFLVFLGRNNGELMTRQKFGDYLSYLSLGVLAIFVVLMLTHVIPDTKKVILRMFSLGLFAGAAIGALTDEVGIKAGSIKKADSPGGFWSMVIFYLVLAIVSLVVSFFE